MRERENATDWPEAVHTALKESAAGKGLFGEIDPDLVILAQLRRVKGSREQSPCR